ncbi:MAG: FAD-binding oxidoreductase [Candidatus Nanopelagicales bacterium]|nr:FAD-binding oxidoreductase [Candidatus Nanopelagicales bacterium]
MAELTELLTDALGAGKVSVGSDIGEDYTHDESLTASWVTPAALVRVESVGDVRSVLSIANEHGVPVTARGAGTGLSGACVPTADGILISFERMNRIIEIDADNSVATVEPGVLLSQLDEALAPSGLAYAVYPGEYSASLGGNVATNAGGMRAVKYGVTRHNVLGLQAVLATGEVIETGGPVAKNSTGYDLTQLIVGSEGTLAIVTRATLKLVPRPRCGATVLAPFTTVSEVAKAVPRIVASGIGPALLEYVDMITMAATTHSADLNLGIPPAVKEKAAAYLVVGLEDSNEDRLEQVVETTCGLLDELGAMDLYVLPAESAAKLISAREKAFWVAKAAGADEIVDTVVPRAMIPEFLAKAQEVATANQTWIAGCGHAGDGNVHLAVFQKDPVILHTVLLELFGAAMDLGGAISGEHALGTEKKRYFEELEDPAKVALMRRVKAAFDPKGILNAGKVFDQEEVVAR